MCPEGAQVELERERCVPKVLKLSSEVNECKPLLQGVQLLHHPRRQGRAVQVDPIKPTLKAPGSKCLKLEAESPPSNFAFKFNLRRHMKDWKLTPDAKFVHICANETIGGVEFKDVPETGDVPLCVVGPVRYCSYTPPMHPLDTPDMPPLHPPYAPYTPPIHPLYTPCTPPIHPLHPYTPPVHPLYNPYTPPIHHLYTPYTTPVHPLYNPYTPPIHSTCIALPCTCQTAPASSSNEL